MARTVRGQLCILYTPTQCSMAHTRRGKLCILYTPTPWSLVKHHTPYMLVHHDLLYKYFLYLVNYVYVYCTKHAAWHTSIRGFKKESLCMNYFVRIPFYFWVYKKPCKVKKSQLLQKRCPKIPLYMNIIIAKIESTGVKSPILTYVHASSISYIVAIMQTPTETRNGT